MFLGKPLSSGGGFFKTTLMLSCLKGSIGVRGCGTAVPKSGMFINDLPGVTLASIDGLTTDDRRTWDKLWNDIEDRCLVRFGNLITAELKKCYQVKSKQCVSDLVCENTDAFYSTFLYCLGEELMNARLFSDRWNRWTMDKTAARELKEHCREQMMAELEIAVKSVDVDTCSACFNKGGGNVQFVTVLP